MTHREASPRYIEPVPIQFACPYCETISSVPDSFAGKQGKCPACNKVIEVPDPNAAEYAEPDPPAPGAGDDYDTKTCKYCGETVRRVAKKCKFCGEFFDKEAQRMGRGGAQPPSYLLLAIASVLCCWPVAIAAIVFAARVSTAHASGRYEDANRYSQTARTLALVAIGVGLLFNALFFVIGAF